VIEPGTYDIRIRSGATFSLDLHFKDSEGNGVDMTGYAVAGQIADRLNTTNLATFDTTFIDRDIGKFRMKVSSTETAGLTSEGQYDILITEPSGDKYYLLKGRVFVDIGVTGV
tara:strand:- start:378 stop:716 length:339 start_codon:yes stop_codon:yes gene_type:complete